MATPQLDILDKHKAIIPVGASHAAVAMTTDWERTHPDVEWLKGTPKGPTIFIRPANRQFPLKDGATVFAAPIDGPPFDDDVQIGIDVAFGEGQILDGEPVIPALTQICEFVEGVFDTFERHILSK